MQNQTLKYEKIYAKQKDIVEKRIAKVFEKLTPDSPYKPASYIANSGGKRLRSFLVQISAAAVGGKFNQVYNSAVAIELFHNFTLVHDDIMDNADKRRGLPTLHVKYDLSTAVLAGDGLIAVAYDYLLKDCKEGHIEVVKDFTTAMKEVCEGQSLDKDLEIAKKFTLEDYLLMIYKKTAALLRASCEIGGKLGNGSKDEIKALSKYGDNLGMAFQLQDDLLDVFGNETKFGKKPGGDLVEGKKTFLLITALNKAKGANKKALSQLVKNNGIDRKEVKKYQEIFKELGVLEDTRKEIEKYSKKAVNSLKGIKDSEYKNILIWLVELLLQRSY
jgi:geranylgeranyl diphosphate synthase type II